MVCTYCMLLQALASMSIQPITNLDTMTADKVNTTLNRQGHKIYMCNNKYIHILGYCPVDSSVLLAAFMC